VSLRYRVTGELLCAAKHPPMPNDTYIDDGLHYMLSVIQRVVIPESDEDVTGRWPMAFATPRSWDCALNLAATCVALGDRGAMQMLMTGTIGEPQALAFCTFEQAQDLVPGLDAARDPSLFKPDAKRPDRTFAQVLAVAQAVCDPHFKGKEAADWWNAGWAFLEYCRALGPEPWSQVPPDMCLVGADYIARRQPSSRCLLAKHEGIIRELAPMVAASIVPEQQS